MACLLLICVLQVTHFPGDDPTILRLAWQDPAIFGGSRPTRYESQCRCNEQDGFKAHSAYEGAKVECPPPPDAPPGIQTKFYEASALALNTHTVMASTAGQWHALIDCYMADKPPQAEEAGFKVACVYEFKVRALNSGGWSVWSRPSLAITTLPPVAPATPAPPVPCDVTPATCVIRWMPPARDHGSAVKAFHVYIHRTPTVTNTILTKRERVAAKQAEESLPARTWQRCSTTDAEPRSVLIRDLTSSSIYHFRVTAENAAGESEQSRSSKVVKPPTRMQYIISKRENKQKAKQRKPK